MFNIFLKQEESLEETVYLSRTVHINNVKEDLVSLQDKVSRYKELKINTKGTIQTIIKYAQEYITLLFELTSRGKSVFSRSILEVLSSLKVDLMDGIEEEFSSPYLTPELKNSLTYTQTSLTGIHYLVLDSGYRFGF